ncbi:hypothetical protein B484DRAFT_459364 [Ochromonadaceae sp. CCMP2298]|nr:hypothetical protein B484DRAFT_459364 [Ochromonadaceae sp. CCMP2298]
MLLHCHICYIICYICISLLTLAFGYQCDAIFVQHELHCDKCNASRSAKILKLYRPLGFKDITLE